MATITVVNDFSEDLANGVHNLSSDTLQIALSNTDPTTEPNNPIADGNGVLANVTQIAYTNYTDDLTVDRVLEGVAVDLASGVATLDANDFTITASGGSIADFQFVYLFNQDATNDELIAVWDQGSPIALTNGDSLLIDFGSDAGTDGDILTISIT